jgi:hypothetical protein
VGRASPDNGIGLSYWAVASGRVVHEQENHAAAKKENGQECSRGPESPQSEVLNAWGHKWIHAEKSK